MKVQNRATSARVFIVVAALLCGIGVVFPGLAHASAIEGFVEGAYAYRTQEDITRKDSFNLLEGRLQLKGLYSPPLMEEWSPELGLKAELVADGFEDRLRLKVREAALAFTPLDIMDVKLGRQILTWGTGDLLFVNDLFPKDYVSFFIGRDNEYLKVPSDAMRVSLFFEALSMDIVAIPFLEPNNSVTGDRLSFFDGLSGALVGDEAGREFIEPDEKPENMELALRAYRTLRRYEVALYFFRGFFKEPRGILDATKREFFYPRLSVYGLSLRGPLLGGIGSFEAGYYDSREDRSGSDPVVQNSSIKYLLGYTRDLGGDRSIGLQYLAGQMLHNASYREALAPGEPVRDEFRHLLTLRFTKLFWAQTINAGIFVFFSPSDMDAYLRPSLGYKVSDNLKLTTGANIFMGRDEFTDFGSFTRNDNIYMRVRYSF